MTLRALIRKCDLGNHATAILATSAMAQAPTAGTVAGIATVAVASSPAGHDLVKVPWSAEAANAETFGGSESGNKVPGPTSKRWPGSMTDGERASAHSKLRPPANTDPSVVIDLWSRTEPDLELPAYFSNPAMDPVPDDRTYCAHCSNLRGRVCVVAKPGGVVSATAGYRPVTDLLLRCAGFAEHPVRAVPISY